MSVALTRELIVDAAYAVLDGQGLAGLTMRRVAQELDVRPGALYYHVANKQELLAEVAARILGQGSATDDAHKAARELRDALRRVRDGAEVVSFVLAFRPEGLASIRALPAAFALPPREAVWAARTLTHYVLGAVAEEQNRAELVRTGILADGPDDVEESFLFGLDAVLAGLRRRVDL
ncbi:transcriptional regulator, TetR family [Pseudonocardia oroxyli]|uniref:Transcriptional regulator, TetR family n=1 Tax=Pseudonocardia oroxyli TaxID=366584 RepID=A0A1G7X905_PSEOR|nr:transcriptional regulator, TetR family [Pseudonocardia oroxyli]